MTTTKQWLIRPHIPLNNVTLLTGDKKQGKGLFCAHIAAHATRGERVGWDTCDDPLEPHQVVWVTSHSPEDDEDVMRSRFVVAGGDLDRFTRLIADDDPVEQVLQWLRAQLLAIEGLKLVVLDPITAVLANLCHPQIRRHVENLVDIARTTGSTLLVIRHLNKAGRTGRGRGEIEEVVRSGLICGKHQGLVVVAHEIASYGEGDPVAFRIQHVDEESSANPPVRLERVVDFDHDVLPVDLLPGRPRPKPRARRTRLDECCEWLLGLLASDGPMLREDVLRKARRRGWLEDTVDRARAHLGLASSGQPGGRFAPVTWSLPSPPATPMADVDQQEADVQNEPPPLPVFPVDIEIPRVAPQARKHRPIKQIPVPPLPARDPVNPMPPDPGVERFRRLELD